MASLDVIVPCYNYGRFLRPCISSLRAQSLDDLRILIIDDASTDDSAETAQQLALEDPRISVVVHSQNQGHIATYNEGIDWVQSDYMLLLSADDMVAPTALDRAIAVMEAHSNVGFVSGRHMDFMEVDGRMLPLRSTRGRYHPAEPPADPDSAEFAIVPGHEFIRTNCWSVNCAIATATAVVRGPLQKRVGGYRPSLPHAGDYEMWLRLAAYGDVGVLQSVQGYSRIHQKNMRHGYIGHEQLRRDYEQRRAAFDAFFAFAGSRLSDAEALSALARRRLAEEVFWDASRKFDSGDLHAMRDLLGLARSFDPEISRSGSWARLRLKRAVGPSVWRFLRRLGRQGETPPGATVAG